MNNEGMLMCERRLAMTAIAIMVVAAGCVKVEYTCVGCHTDQTTLEEVAAPINYPSSGGDG